jgi:protein O-mannosyl-transferase
VSRELWKARVGWRTVVLPLVPSLLAGFVYLNALQNPFVYDDNRTIVDNASLLQLGDIRAIVWHDITRPIVNLSYAIDRRIWGPTPFGFHVTSVLLHMLSVCLLFQLARSLARDRNLTTSKAGEIQPEAAAFAAAAFFAVHPLMTQAVAYISGRSEVLCAVFFVAALLAGRRWMTNGGAGFWLLTLALWMASILTKESGVMLPFVLLAIDRLMLRGTVVERRRRFLKLHLPLLALALVGAIARTALFVVYEQPSAAGIKWTATLDAAIVTWRYASLLVLPVGQSVFHEIRQVVSVTDPRATASVLGLGLLLAVAWGMRRRLPMLSLAVLWFLLLLLPSSALIVLDLSGDMAEHRLYLASAGAFLAVGTFFGWIVSGTGVHGPLRWVALLLLPTALLSLSGRTLLRNAIWSSPVLLWGEAVDRAPAHWMPRTVLGESLHDAGRHEEAVTAHRLALAANSEEESIYLKLGFCLAELGRFDEAKATFNQLRARHPQSRTALTGLGIVAMMSHHPDQARERFHDAIALDAREIPARQWLAALEENAGRSGEALRLCEEIQRLAPVSLGNQECVRRNRAKLGRGAGG